MLLKIKAALLLCLMAAAALTASEAWRTLKVDKAKGVPGEIYEKILSDGEEAEYFLRESGGFVAVFRGEKDKTPMTVTGIETSVLRKADRAMLELGIPVSDGQALLMLLEDLGS